jgi:hypothetical protein
VIFGPDRTGWYEFILDGKATTHVAYVHEGGSVYLPEADVTEDDFLFASAAGRVFRLMRTEDVWGTCDWGDCGEVAVSARSVPVCERHRGAT